MRVLLFAAGFALPLSLSLAAPAAAQRSDPDFTRGGPAGCFDPARISADKQQQLIRMGSRPCPSKNAVTLTGSWYGDANATGADDATKLGLSFGVICEGGQMAMTIVPKRDAAERLFNGMRAVPVTLASPVGNVTIALPKQSDGEYWTIINTDQLAALKSSGSISASGPNWTARFSGAGSARRLGALTCRARSVVATPATSKTGAARWFETKDEFGRPKSLYGLPNAGPSLVLTCGKLGLQVSLQNVDEHPARRRTILLSGDQRFEAPTVITGEEISSLNFTVPYNEPILRSVPANGLNITFRNGERNPFPGSPILARLLTGCGRR